MRVAIVTTSYPRTDEDPSGHFVRAYARALAARGDEVHVVAPGGSLLNRPKESGGVTVHRAGGGGLFKWPGALARLRRAPWLIAGGLSFAAGAAFRLRSIGRVDRAVAHWIVPSAFPLLLGVEAPLEVHAHGADVRLLVRAPRAARDLVLRALLARDARFVFAARALLDGLLRSLPSETRFALEGASHVEAPPIDLPDVAGEARERKRSIGAPFGVVACRLIASKRVDLAIDAAAHARLRLIVVGDGPERKALEDRARALGGAVTFAGALPRREALAFIAAASILVHPSAVESAPTVVREARALGVPVVACDAGDVRAWAEDDAGIVVSEATAIAIGRVIESLLRGET